MRALALLLLLVGVARAQQPTLTPPPPPPPPPKELSLPPPPAPAPTATPAPTPAKEPLTPSAASPEGERSRGAPPPAPAAETSDDLKLLGVMLDLGFPDGLAASLVVRPIRFTRLYAGPTYNFLAPGLRLGGTLVPFDFFITPTLTGEYGHAFNGNAGKVVSKFGTLDAFEKAALEKVGYDYLSVQLGIESGSPRTFAWFFRAGVAWLFVRAPNFDQAAQTKGISSTNPKIRAAIPTVSTGVYLFVW